MIKDISFGFSFVNFVSMNCLVLGGSGATGQQLLKHLSLHPNVSKIVSLNRREILDQSWPKVEHKVVDFRNLSLSDFDDSINVGFCCIGSTLSKATRAEFEFVERDMILECAQFLMLKGCQHFHLVTGHASDSNASFFIPRIKGECEDKIIQLNFSRLVIYRPGLLRCSRPETRWLEAVARFISNWVDSSRNWWSISTEDLAHVMIEQAVQDFTNPAKANGVLTLSHSQIVQLLTNLKCSKNVSDK